MTAESVIAKIGEIGIVPVVRASSVGHAIRAVEAICAGGIPIAEITMTVPDAVAAIRQITRDFENQILPGAGTITTADQAKCAIDAGAQFIVSPGLSIPVLAAAQANGVLGIPGVLTPTELMSAHENGARLIKIFPCGPAGGPQYLKALRGPFPQANLIPTGGINPANAAEFIKAGAFALGVGGELISAAALREENFVHITQIARQLVQAVQTARRSPVPAY